MKMDWEQFVGHGLTITMQSNYGVVHAKKKEDPDIYEPVIKTGTLLASFDDGLLLESVRNNQIIKLFVKIDSIKFVEIY